MLAGQPADGPNAAEELPILVGWIDETIRGYLKAAGLERHPRDFDFAGLENTEMPPDEARVARDILAHLSASGVEGRVAKLATCTRWVLTSDGAPLFDDKKPGLGNARFVSRINLGRMTIAREKKNWDGWLVAFEELLKLGALVGREPSGLSNLVSVAIQAAAFERARAAIADLDSATLERLERAITAWPLPPACRLIQGDGLLALDTLEFVYERGPDALVWLQDTSGSPPPPKPDKPAFGPEDDIGPGMPSLREQRELFAQVFDELERHAGLPISVRRTEQKRSELIRGNLLLEMFVPPTERVLEVMDQYRADRAGIRTLIALERYHRKHGEYPERLAQVTPDFLETVVDPGTGKELGYLPPSKGPYPRGRAFVLYSSGSDGDDDDGKIDYDRPFEVVRGAANGDYLLNR